MRENRKRRLLDEDCTEPCQVLLQDLQQSRDPYIRRQYLRAKKSAEVSIEQKIARIYEENSRVSVNARELADLFTEVEELRNRLRGRPAEREVEQLREEVEQLRDQERATHY